jgi:alkyl sulfatase BDS1-like metallo-beta-lactamase superfamily hydrolase
MDLLELADRLWRGEARIEDHHPMSITGEIAEVAPGVAFVASFANVSAFTTGDGMVLVDTGSQALGGSVRETLRGWTGERLHTAIYSHGHIDHVFGVRHYEEEARAKDWPSPVVVAHEGVPARFDRYKLTAGFNSAINQRQFQVPGLQWPTEYRYPDVTYRDRLDLEIGGERFELRHARGETDDHTWTWVPGRKVLCSGDFFIWASPNAGNPQKVQRYAGEWAIALREMASLGAEVMLPGHGLPVVGAERVRAALSETAELLESLQQQTLELMNRGARLDEVLRSVKPPAHLLQRPYLHPIYDEPEFVVRNIWRLYGGWFDGNPAHLKPPAEAALAAEIARLAGGAEALARRASEIASDGDLALASELAEMAALADPASAAIQEARAEVYERRAAEEASTMSRGIFAWAARESRERTG